MTYRLRRHPISVSAHFRHSLVLFYVGGIDYRWERGKLLAAES